MQVSSVLDPYHFNAQLLAEMTTERQGSGNLKEMEAYSCSRPDTLFDVCALAHGHFLLLLCLLCCFGNLLPEPRDIGMLWRLPRCG